MAPLLVCKDLKLSFATKHLFDAVTLGVEEGDRIGIVGKNGDGKSSLLRMLAEDLVPDAGEVMRRSDVTVGFLCQKDTLSLESTALQAAVGNTPAHEWAAERRSREIIEVLLAGIDHNALVKELSGGGRRRVDLARLLIGSWDLLMLDEPTNHLDMQTITWLAEHLKQRWPAGSGALLVVTHDRWFLDEVCTTMLEVHDKSISSFEGGYSAYILKRVERDRLLQLAEEKRQNMIRKELAWLSRGARARATKPKFHVKIAQELIADEPPPRNTLELKRTAMARLGKQVIEFAQVTETLGAKPILLETNLLIGPGDRIAILGENGVGKTTLLRLMTGALAPTSGEVKIGQTVCIACLSQQLEELDNLQESRVLEVLKNYKQSYFVEGKQVSSTELLRRLGFEQEYFMARVKDLSGGQKRRLQLLLTLLNEPNVILFDEPGNDFDTDMLVVLEDLLDSWPGTLVLVSHDRYLVERVTDLQYALINGELRHLPGGVDEYLKLVEGKQRALAPMQKQNSLQNTKTGALSAAESHELRKQLASTERRIHTLEKQICKQTDVLHATDPTDYLALGKTQNDLDELQATLLELETIWFELHEKLDA
jgi:ATPase subunit of ABC transporter with duplicated ATPase domains